MMSLMMMIYSGVCVLCGLIQVTRTLNVLGSIRGDTVNLNVYIRAKYGTGKYIIIYKISFVTLNMFFVYISMIFILLLF